MGWDYTRPSAFPEECNYIAPRVRHHLGTGDPPPHEARLDHVVDENRNPASRASIENQTCSGVSHMDAFASIGDMSLEDELRTSTSGLPEELYTMLGEGPEEDEVKDKEVEKEDEENIST
ncbi:hypothetical protein B296_00020160 [Ensete ventricosum]|uniref:Uncharacterized protein n=1 Tax=Ensete ventricosum TaxID=4639 RepID=A0A426XFW1_ENSVE|nr:hypothetical protein B296_00020160 [Ensete ventricosum]